MPELPVYWMKALGEPLLWSEAALALAALLCSLLRPEGRLYERLLALLFLLYSGGFLLIAWFHWEIHQRLSLPLPTPLIPWLNQGLKAAGGLPLLDPASPPRYSIPPWIEAEKYHLWALFFSLAAWLAARRLASRPFRILLSLGLLAHAASLLFWQDPFSEPLPKFFGEVRPFFGDVSPSARIGLFMRLYPRMLFYYNAHYMWVHPPLLFLSYACVSVAFAASLVMLGTRDEAVESVGYAFAKTGFFSMTVGMLLGYPWAVKAWGPNWWWDPKIMSSIMMWAVYSTYLHARLYIRRPGVWYLSAGLGILCFAAMMFTFLASFFFPGEHTGG